MPNLSFYVNSPLSGHTRFEIGGPTQVLADASTEKALIDVLAAIKEAGWRHTVIGGGSNLIVDDKGFDGAVVRYTARGIEIGEANRPSGGAHIAGGESRGESGDRKADRVRVRVEAGAVLQDLVDATIAAGLRGLETMTGIPGWVGGAIYGNAGAYGHSIEECVERVRFFDGRQVREIATRSLRIRYRESVFKRHKDWIVLVGGCCAWTPSCRGSERAAASILKIRNEKYPPEMRCAGSIFKNLFVRRAAGSVRAGVYRGLVRRR